MIIFEKDSLDLMVPCLTICSPEDDSVAFGVVGGNATSRSQPAAAPASLSLARPGPPAAGLPHHLTNVDRWNRKNH